MKEPAHRRIVRGRKAQFSTHPKIARKIQAKSIAPMGGLEQIPADECGLSVMDLYQMMETEAVVVGYDFANDTALYNDKFDAYMILFEAGNFKPEAMADGVVDVDELSLDTKICLLRINDGSLTRLMGSDLDDEPMAQDLAEEGNDSNFDWGADLPYYDQFDGKGADSTGSLYFKIGPGEVGRMDFQMGEVTNTGLLGQDVEANVNLNDILDRYQQQNVEAGLLLAVVDLAKPK